MDGVHTLVLAGELDVVTAPRLSAALDALSGIVLLDCDGLRFVDSSGLSTILRHHQLLHSAGGKLLLGRPSVAMRRLLEITDLTELIV
jgi:anti-sigma B factor antagonist